MITILHLEDNVLDHKLVVAKLHEEKFEFTITRVDSRLSFERAMSERIWDLFLADFNLPDFDGLSALTLVNSKSPGVPFIIVSGAMGEIAAVDVMKAGATDYVLKEALDRLGPAIHRAQRERDVLIAKESAEKALILAKDTAESANRAKDRFIAVLSHELRTPLSPVLLTLSTMAVNDRIPLDLRPDIAMMRRNIDLEIKLIDDLLDLNRIISGKLSLENSFVDAHSLIEHVLQSAVQDTSARELRVVMTLEAKNSWVNADAARLQQVLWNLVRNAIKFTPNGGTISISTRNLDECFMLEITDSGVGISAEALTRVFNAFEQEDQSITRRFGGLGLGLSVSRAIVDMLKGTISARSAGAGKGSTFTLKLPSAPAPAAEKDDAPATPQETSPSEVRLLLVEDHADTRDVLTRWLSSSGYAVSAAEDVSSALAMAEKHAFDIVVSDIGLPDGTGHELMAQLSSRHGLRGIALTGFGMEDDIKKGRSSGFLKHIVKPVDFFKLEEAIKSVLG